MKPRHLRAVARRDAIQEARALSFYESVVVPWMREHPSEGPWQEHEETVNRLMDEAVERRFYGRLTRFA